MLQFEELKLSLEDEFKVIEENFAKKAGSDYAASRGEYLNGIIMANYLGYEFLDAAEAIFFDEEGVFEDYIRELEEVRLMNNPFHQLFYFHIRVVTCNYS